MPHPLPALSLVATVAVFACAAAGAASAATDSAGGGRVPGTAAARPPADDGIAWHRGDPAEAFARAGKEGKPLFLYWGAVWCPPCNQIKKTVFTQRAFIDKMKLFLPVYLDGDTASAQTWGEKLKASGYPTMIVMSPQGKEVLRMPMGLQADEFVAVLDEALQRMTPVGEVLESVLAAPDPAQVPDRSFRLLAYYSWSQDEALQLSPEAREEKLRRLEARVPARLAREKSRLYLEWLRSRLELAEGVEGKPGRAVEAAERAAARARVEAILADPALTVANLLWLEAAAADFVRGLEPEAGAGRDALVAAWLKAMDRVEEDPALSVDERLSALVPAIDLHHLVQGEKTPASARLQARIRARVLWADESAKDGQTRQAAMSTAGYLLREAGLPEEAKQLYRAQLEKATSPHYFMSSLAALARKEGKTDEAIDWMRRAYETAKGPATRFQWGTSYLGGLIDLAPQDGARVRDESLRVLKEVLAADDAFSGRNHAGVRRLDKKFKEWNAAGDHAAEVEALRDALAPSCSRLSDRPVEGASVDESPRGRCTAFFAGLGGGKPAAKTAQAAETAGGGKP